MNWQDHLITIYLYVCKHYQNELWVYSQRMTNYADLSFSDEEVITLYLFGIIDKNRELKKFTITQIAICAHGFQSSPATLPSSKGLTESRMCLRRS
jgi:hypothetical protein